MRIVLRETFVTSRWSRPIYQATTVGRGSNLIIKNADCYLLYIIKERLGEG